MDNITETGHQVCPCNRRIIPLHCGNNLTLGRQSVCKHTLCSHNFSLLEALVRVIPQRPQERGSSSQKLICMRLSARDSQHSWTCFELSLISLSLSNYPQLLSDPGSPSTWTYEDGCGSFLFRRDLGSVVEDASPLWLCGSRLRCNRTEPWVSLEGVELLTNSPLSVAWLSVMSATADVAFCMLLIGNNAMACSGEEVDASETANALSSWSWLRCAKGRYGCACAWRQ